MVFDKFIISRALLYRCAICMIRLERNRRTRRCRAHAYIRCLTYQEHSLGRALSESITVGQVLARKWKVDTQPMQWDRG